MEMSGTFQLVTWIFIGVLAMGALVYAFMEYQAYMLRTSVYKVPGGLVFKSQMFECEIRRESRTVVVRTRNGHLTRQALAGGAEEVQTGVLEAVLPAPGIEIDLTTDVTLVPARHKGVCTAVFRASDALQMQASGQTGGQSFVLSVPQVPAPVAANFQQFANQIAVWAEKLEHTMALEVQARQRKEEEEARAAAKAAAAASAVPAKPLTPEERDAKVAAQIAQWRAKTGFTGSSSEVSANAQGDIEWFVDVSASGRITLCAGDRTFHGSLKGARITSLGGEIEVAVRDDYWTKENPELMVFVIMKGAAPDVRRAWKERLTMIRDSLGGDPP